MTKEERIQESANIYASKKSSSEVFKRAHIEDFIAGANWNEEQEIEDNNGWIKIEDKQITKFNDSFDLVFTNKGNIYTYATFCNFSSIYELEKVTHFQQITKPQPPIY